MRLQNKNNNNGNKNFKGTKDRSKFKSKGDDGGGKSFPDKLSRFRNDIAEFSSKFGGVDVKKSNYKAPMSRKLRRKLERNLKHAKNAAFHQKTKTPTFETFVKSISLAKKKEKAALQNIKDSFSTPSTEETKQKEPKTKKQNKKVDEPPKQAKTTIELLETKILNEEKKRKNFETLAQVILIINIELLNLV
jgi:hypothetical protein